MNALIKIFSYITAVLLAFTACQTKSDNQESLVNGKPRELSQAWKDYWYNGTAELNRYDLEQARYGEMRKGDAVLIFVTEDFLADRQVKYEGGPKDQVTSVLKLNATKKFWTGVYPYSLMTSTFTPIAQASPSLKVTTSAQEWCGHSFSQLNLRGGQYEGLLRSYFMREGDQSFSLDAVLLEDEVWNQIRMNPEALPTGTLKMIPGTQFLRLRHRAFQVETVEASLTQADQPDLLQYRIDYQGFNRVLEIIFEKNAPYKIIGWKETSGDGRDGALTTRATLTNSLRSPYWGKNSLADSVLRQSLGLWD